MRLDQARPRRGSASRITAAVIALAGLAQAMPGAYLLALGGSAFYLFSGVVLFLAGVQLLRGRSSGYLLFSLALFGTFVWALRESGFDGWALLPRLDLVLALALALRLSISARPWRDLGVVAVTIAVLAGFAITRPLPPDSGVQPTDAPPSGTAGADWDHIGGTASVERFSPLTQITPANVGRLEEAWRVRLGMPPPQMYGTYEATPLKIGDLLYTCTMHGVVVAVDADSGTVKWKFDPQIDPDTVVMGACRGVTYVKAPQANSCRERVVTTTYNARLVALDARTGTKCPGFGNGGEVDLLAGMGAVTPGYYFLTSPAALVRGKLVLGGSVVDNQKTLEPSGVIRAFDAVTGAFAWAWDMERPDDHGMPPEGSAYSRGTPNAWAPISADEELGIAFVPLGNPTPDYVTAHRSPAMLKYGSSVVALDAETGQVRWHYQTTHNDVWDYDLPTSPMLTDFPTPDGLRPALIQPTKRGEFFVLDRRTGEPLVDTVERPVPQQGKVPEVQLSQTQPYPVGMPSFGGGYLDESEMWGISPFDQLWCRIRYRQVRYAGDFTPMSLLPTLIYPGYFGGTNWFGASVDPDRRVMVFNVLYFPSVNRLVPRAEADAQGSVPFEPGRKRMNVKTWPMAGTPYAVQTFPLMSPLGVPCKQPPFSEIAAVDLTTRTVMWRHPLGTARDSGPFGLKLGLPIPMGVPALGGSLVTRSGLVFIAATQERTLRALDTRTGALLWQARLPTSAHANPMTFLSDRSGRQFVVITAAGHRMMGTETADWMIAYALPKS